MKLHSTNYYNTFILVADDCPVSKAEIPAVKNDTRTAAVIQFELVSKHPYKYTSDDVLFQVFAEKKDLTKAEFKHAREAFFSKGQACLRASPLTKRYGWGVHSNAEGKIAIFACESPHYEKLAADKKLKVVKAMKSSR